MNCRHWEALGKEVEEAVGTDWAGKAIYHYEFYKLLFSLLSFRLAEERSTIMSLFQRLALSCFSFSF